MINNLTRSYRHQARNMPNTQSDQFNLTNLTLHTNKIGIGKIVLNLAASFVEISLFESIDETMSGYVSIVDSLNINDTLPLYGNEKIELSFQTNNSDHDINYTGYVYKISERIRVSEHAMGYKILFCSESLLKSERSFVNTCFKDTQNKIVSEIYQKFLIGEDNKSIITEDSLGITDYAFGSVKPLEAIEILSRDAISTQNNSGYLFFENNQNYNFLPIQFLYQQTPVAKYVSQIGGYYSDLSKHNIEQFESIQDIKYYDNNSFIDRLADGIHGSEHVYFDILTKEMKSYHYKRSENFNRLKTLGYFAERKLLPDGNDVVYFGYSKDKFSRSKNEMLSRMKLTESKMFRAAITIVGNSKLKAGDVLEVYFPRLNIDQQEIVNSYEGKVLISSIRHTITPTHYMQEVDVIKDSYTQI